jgi:diguanylate cyclase (GGDEF)-like protein
VVLVPAHLSPADTPPHGHAAGDAALRALADRLRERLRTEDIAGRFGGEEFVIALPDADAAGAAAAAEAVRAAVCARPLTIAGRELNLTVSVGWASWEDDDLGQLLARADGALYEAKAAGRDCVRPRADSPT